MPTKTLDEAAIMRGQAAIEKQAVPSTHPMYSLQYGGDSKYINIYIYIYIYIHCLYYT